MTAGATPTEGDPVVNKSTVRGSLALAMENMALMQKSIANAMRVLDFERGEVPALASVQHIEEARVRMERNLEMAAQALAGNPTARRLDVIGPESGS